MKIFKPKFRLVLPFAGLTFLFLVFQNFTVAPRVSPPDQSAAIQARLSTLVCLKNDVPKLTRMLLSQSAVLPENSRYKVEDKLLFLNQQEELCLDAQSPRNQQALTRLKNVSNKFQSTSPQAVRKRDTSSNPSSRDCFGEWYNEQNYDLSEFNIQPIAQIIQDLDYSLLPLKYDLTCVRNQSPYVRGTCVAFGTVATMETWASKLTAVKVNLSEQAFYAVAKDVWYPTSMAPNYGDGLDLNSVLAGMLSSNYVMMPGELWPYNPSYGRIDTGSGYTHSCDNYPAPAGLPQSWSYSYCSDTNHQSRFNSIAGVYDPWIAMPGGYYSNLPKLDGYYVISSSVFTGSSLIEAGKAWLDSGTPLIGAIWTTPSFFDAGADPQGIVNPNLLVLGPGGGIPAEEAITGGHAFEVVGYVTNENLPSGYAAGQGGGYFIIKNSFGTGWGDKGYALLSFAYYWTYGQGFWVPVVSMYD